MDGYHVMTIRDACPEADFIVTATGLEGVIRAEHFPLMKDGVLIGNAGHSDLEIDVPALRSLAVSSEESRENVFEYTLAAGKRIGLLADGRIVNIAGGFGHPAEILDMSFALQLASLHHILAGPLRSPEIYPVPVEIDEMVVREKIAAEGFCID